MWVGAAACWTRAQTPDHAAHLPPFLPPSSHRPNLPVSLQQHLAATHPKRSWDRQSLEHLGLARREDAAGAGATLAGGAADPAAPVINARLIPVLAELDTRRTPAATNRAGATIGGPVGPGIRPPQRRNKEQDEKACTSSLAMAGVSPWCAPDDFCQSPQ